jgi:hypothetical protein
MTVFTSRFLATDLTLWRFFSFPHSNPLVTATHAELLPTDNQLGHRLAAISHQPHSLLFTG